MTQPTDLFALPDEDLSLPKDMAIYITDQSHPAHLEQLPPNAPGFSVTVWRKRKCLESMWCRSRAQAEQMAQEYFRQYVSAKLCGWR